MCLSKLFKFNKKEKEKNILKVDKYYSPMIGDSYENSPPEVLKEDDEDRGIAQSIYLYNKEQAQKDISRYLLLAKFTLEDRQEYIEEIESDYIEETPILEEVESFKEYSILQKKIFKIEDLHEPDLSLEIINLLKRNDQSVFEYLYEYELPKIVRLVIKNSGNIESAEDIFQEALLILYEKVCKNELNLTCSFSTYLYSVSRILWLEQLRLKDNNLVLFEDYEFIKVDSLIEDSITVPEDYENVKSIIINLGKSCQDLLEYYYFRKMDWKEIAQKLGYSNEGSARNQKYKCIQRIKKELEEIGKMS
jgi:RNA polymerase sigma factor (sigma-70 family)